MLGNVSYLKYTKDYLENYRDNIVRKSHKEIMASFDNERNYVQQWLTKNGFKDLKELKDFAYVPNISHKNTASQEKAAIQYFKEIEQGLIPSNCSTGEWMRYKFKKNMHGAWAGISMWSDHTDFTIAAGEGSRATGFITYEDAKKHNREIQKMIEEDLPIIANLTHLSKKEKTTMVELLCNGVFINTVSSYTLSAKRYPEFVSSGTMRDEIRNKWNTEYLPNTEDARYDWLEYDD